ncbi:signal peptidase II [Defluviitalea phaphyphila]|uniref:signal peptidase II n=1 Tax=Defluviitalea phaphyphila TaxID=1473580 RepID=UPI000ACD55DA|nr:signal peptidase II [Defluviitalea phaphyphila]
MFIVFFLLVSVLVFIDQLTKYIALNYLKSISTIPIIQNIFHLTFVENRGAAFGILQNKRWFFIIITFTILLGIIYYYINLPKEKPYGFVRFSLILISSGAIGNLIDRIKLGYVIDFFDFRLINFPVFNIADIYVVIGTILLSSIIFFMPHKDL